MNYYNRILFLAPLIIFNYSFSQDYNVQQKKLEAQKLSIKNVLPFGEIANKLFLYS